MRTYAAMTLTALALGMICPAPLPADEATDYVLVNDSFESGTMKPDGWKQGAAVPGVRYVYDRRVASEGQRSLSLQKSANRYFPIAGWSRLFDHESDRSALKVSAQVKAARATKAVIDVVFLDANGQWIEHEWVAYIGQKERTDAVATHDWKTYEGTLEIPAGTEQIGIALQIYGPGSVWFDELKAEYVDSATGGADDGSASAPEPSAKRGGCQGHGADRDCHFERGRRTLHPDAAGGRGHTTSRRFPGRAGAPGGRRVDRLRAVPAASPRERS